MAERELWVVRLGRMGYEECLELQREVARQRISGAISQDVLLLVEHPPVVTLGRASKQKNLISSPEFLRSRGVELFEVERGGDVTFHGPGQLVGQPLAGRCAAKEIPMIAHGLPDFAVIALYCLTIQAWNSQTL